MLCGPSFAIEEQTATARLDAFSSVVWGCFVGASSVSALLELSYEMVDLWFFCCAQTYVKGPLGQNGVGPISAGFILDKSIEL